MAKIKASPKFRLNEADIKRWLKNAAIFLAPAAIAMLMVFQADGTVDEALIVLKLWALNTGVDLLRKFIAGNSK